MTTKATAKTASATETTPPPSAEATTPKWSETTINVTYRTSGAPTIYVIRVPPPKGHEGTKGYFRAMLRGPGIGVSDLRLATRFDSATWARTVASFVPGSKVCKLVTKATVPVSAMLTSVVIGTKPKVHEVTATTAAGAKAATP